MLKESEKVKEVKITRAKIEQFFCFDIDNIRLKNDRDDEFVKRCVKVGNCKNTPLIQEETILDVFDVKNYPKYVEYGPFGIGGESHIFSSRPSGSS